ncbi:hypothetical protein GPK63_01395 [Faecalibacterium prausnitzii]|uniref:hypothetical protein n=1 Tax=Faecalibacterium prausnitzii TaxID=853 RepID=UPI001C011F11|nr:hypothetical protein [Faecalibacterium prausnitzii]MBT9711454.1 hypothetical protein [Faecalibacterium prausnitzii]
MDKMTIYESARGVPKEARKSIGGGRLKGMTDINPMWRVKKLTELFGPAGIGWRFDPPVFEEKPGVNGEIMVHCCTNLYIRQIDEGGEKNEWSAPIPGVGGSMLISTEKDGKRTDDEAYKRHTRTRRAWPARLWALAQTFTGRRIRPSTTSPQRCLRQSPPAPAAGSPWKGSLTRAKRSLPSRRLTGARKNTGVSCAWNALKNSRKKMED